MLPLPERCIGPHNMIETAACYGPQRDRNNGTRPVLMMTMYDEQDIWARLSERDKTLATFLASGLIVEKVTRRVSSSHPSCRRAPAPPAVWVHLRFYALVLLH